MENLGPLSGPSLSFLKGTATFNFSFNSIDLSIVTQSPLQIKTQAQKTYLPGQYSYGNYTFPKMDYSDLYLRFLEFKQETEPLWVSRNQECVTGITLCVIMQEPEGVPIQKKEQRNWEKPLTTGQEHWLGWKRCNLLGNPGTWSCESGTMKGSRRKILCLTRTSSVILQPSTWWWPWRGYCQQVRQSGKIGARGMSTSSNPHASPPLRSPI